MSRNSSTIITTAAFSLGLATLLAAESLAQWNDRPPTGMMLGSTLQDRVRGNDRNRDRDRDRDRHFNPPAWMGGVHFIRGYGNYGCDQPVIIVNNSPCYIPGYYAGMRGY